MGTAVGGYIAYRTHGGTRKIMYAESGGLFRRNTDSRSNKLAHTYSALPDRRGRKAQHQHQQRAPGEDDTGAVERARVEDHRMPQRE